KKECSSLRFLLIGEILAFKVAICWRMEIKVIFTYKFIIFLETCILASLSIDLYDLYGYNIK
ncbi:hypothetical protein, partial [Clostridioides difficile]|uniref:hypothetical protein n=2 Tax=Clostridioides difficile TaxID=1496 RepID=UPI001A9B80EB